MTTLHDKAELFRSLHSGRMLILANAWDVASARLVEEAGAAAIATTSAGVAWSQGVPDGEQLDRQRALEVIARIASAVGVPVTADIEGGYAAAPDGVAATIRDVLAAGAVGVNLEDTDHSGRGPLRPIEEQGERIAAARQAADALAVPLFLNARVDIYLRSVGDPATRLPDTLARAQAYIVAGADGIFVPGLTDPRVISALVAGLQAPLNVLAGVRAPSIAVLAELGVARVSFGSSIAAAAYAVVRRSARELSEAGTYTALEGALDTREVNALMRDLG